MSDESELNRLRADLKAMERVKGLVYFGEDFKVRFYEKIKAIRDKIAKLEADADPWRKAKSAVEYFRGFAPHKVAEHDVVRYVDHLTSENARLTARVAELEAAAKAEDEADIADAEAVLDDMQPPFEGPVVGFEPVLEPNRVLATAVEALAIRRLAAQTRDRLTTLCNNAKPYPLKKGCEA